MTEAGSLGTLLVGPCQPLGNGNGVQAKPNGKTESEDNGLASSVVLACGLFAIDEKSAVRVVSSGTRADVGLRDLALRVTDLLGATLPPPRPLRRRRVA